MRRWFEDFSYRMQSFMQGRHGKDPLTNVLYIMAIILLILSLFAPLRFLWYIALAILIFSVYRMFSRNHTAREKELQLYEKIRSTISGKFRLLKGMYRDRGVYTYVKCPNCKTYIRLKTPPKGKTIRINCPKCKNSFEKRT